MESSLLATKLFVPSARPGLVPRPRLMERLQAAVTCRLTLISAQAGYGKSTVLTQWYPRRTRCRDIQRGSRLDEGDNDPVRFWDYFIAALRTLRPFTGEAALALLHSPQPYPTESVLTSLINDLASDSIDLVVILDDYHLIKSDLIHSAMAFLLNHLPPGLHLVISTRSDPPLPLAHLRGQGVIIEIGADDLRFTTDEAAAMLSNVPDLELSESEKAAINGRTEGWAVGLAIAALSLRRQKDIRGFISTFAGSHRYVMDYLVEEVLRQQTNEIQDFLLRTSILDRLTASVCEKLTGQSRSREMLAELESTITGFLMPLDESRRWFRYHHLFAELLRHELALRLEPGEVSALNLRASQWCEENGLPNDAVQYALRAHDWAKAIRLISDVAESLMARGEMLTLIAWLRVVPDGALSTNRQLFRLYVDALITTNQIAAAEPALTYLEQTSAGDPGQQGANASARADMAWFRGELAQAIDLSRDARAVLPPDDVKNRTGANWIIGRNAFGVGLIRDSEAPLVDAYKGALTLGNQQIAGGAEPSRRDIRGARRAATCRNGSKRRHTDVPRRTRRGDARMCAQLRRLLRAEPTRFRRAACRRGPSTSAKRAEIIRYERPLTPFSPVQELPRGT